MCNEIQRKLSLNLCIPTTLRIGKLFQAISDEINYDLPINKCGQIVQCLY